MAGPGNIKNRIQPHVNLVRNPKVEATLGFLMLILACVLIWDAFDNRGKKLPWPVSGLLPW